MNVSQLNPEEILEKVFLPEYQSKIDLAHGEIVLINSNLFVLRELHGFRFDLFVLPQHQTLRSLVWNNLERMSAVSICKLATDQSPGSVTLQKLAGEVVRSCKPKFQIDVRKHLKDAAPSVGTRKLLDRIRELRDKRLAHLDGSFDFDAWRKSTQLTLNHLEAACREVTRYFHAVCFGHGRAELPLPYLTARESPNDSDVRRLLDGIAGGSALLNMPESEPSYWKTQWKQYSAKDINLINAYRRVEGLRERDPNK